MKQNEITVVRGNDVGLNCPAIERKFANCTVNGEGPIQIKFVFITGVGIGNLEIGRRSDLTPIAFITNFVKKLCGITVKGDSPAANVDIQETFVLLLLITLREAGG